MINKEIKTIGRIFQVLIFGGLGLWLAFGILVRQAQAGSPTFYIDATAGNDLTGNGSGANPYRTIQPVSLTAQTCGADLTQWNEYTANPVFDPITNRAYYPTVIYDASSFSHNVGDVISASLPYTYTVDPHYKMWVATGQGGEGIQFAYSEDGLIWYEFNSGQALPGLFSTGYHNFVMYDLSGFGGVYKYKIWYWNGSLGYNISDIRYAESADGILWENDQPLTQDAGRPIIQTTGWNRGSYGPNQLFFNSGGSAILDDVDLWNNKYVMYYNGTDGNHEYIGLGYSTDGKHWKRYADTPVVPLGMSGTWDDYSVSYASIVRISATEWHMWYSASGGSAGTNHGIGYAASADGITWSKSIDNPIFHKGDGVSWRDNRTYTPLVLYSPTRFDGHGSPEQYKMWFSGRSSTGNYAIGYATLNPVHLSATFGNAQSGPISATLSQPFVAELRDSCNSPASQVVVTFAISDTPPGATGPSLSVISGTTNSAGQISTTLRLGSLTGTYTVLAAASGVTSMPTIFTATAIMPPPPVVWVDDDFNAGNTGGHTWGYDAFVTVQEGINAVITGGTVYVAAGIYNENPYIDKSLTLRSESGAAATTLDGKDDAPYGVFIAANDVTLDGFTVTNPGYTYSSDASGLVIESSAGPISNIRIAHNSIHDVASLTRSSVTYGTVGINIGAVAGPVVGVELDSNEIYNIQHSASDAWANGISIWGNDNTAQVSNVNIHNNLIYNVFSPYTGDAGISAQDFVTGVVVYRNSITGTGEFGVEVRGSSVITATENWWGNATGPTHTSNPPGAGEHVTDLVAFNPWLCQGVDTSPDIGFQPNPTLCSVASRLEFVTSPGDALVNQPLTPQPVVRAVDADGNLATTFNSAITLTIETNPAGGVLSGTTTLMAAQGVVTFTGLSINKAGRGYSLSASAATLTSTTSPTFTIYAVAPLPTEKKFFLPIIFKNSH